MMGIFEKYVRGKGGKKKKTALRLKNYVDRKISFTL